MSSHTYQGGGGQSQDEKGDVGRLSGQPQPAQPHVLTSAVPHGDIIAKNFQAIRTTVATQRPIAPAPGPSISHITNPVSMASAQLVGASHSLVKVPTALMGPVVEASLAGTGTAVNIGSVQPQQQNPAGGAAATLGIASQATTNTGVQQPMSIPAGTPVNLQTSGTNIVQASLPITHQVQMASLIRGPQLQALQQQTGQQGATPIVHAFQSHVPRGAVAASALAAPRSSAVATAVLRPSQAASGIITPGSATVTPGQAQMLAAQQIIQPRALLPVRPGTPTTPPVTRSASPSVNVPASIAHADPHRPLLTPHGVATTTATTVQITIQQPKTVTEITPRTMLSQIPQQQTKQLPLSQAILQSQLPVQTQKVVMSQAAVSPMIQPSTTTGGVAKVAQGQTYYGVPRTQKIVVSQPTVSSLQTSTLVSTGATSSKTVGGKTQKIMMAQPGGATLQPNTVSLGQHTGVGKTQKIMMTQPAALQAHSNLPLVNPGTLGLPVLKTQKIVMTPQTNHSIHHGATVSVATAAGKCIKAQKIVMSQSGVPNIQPTTTVTLTPQGHKVIGQAYNNQKSVSLGGQDNSKSNIANPTISLNQSLARPSMQKVVMSQVSVTGSSQMAPSAVAVPKTVGVVGATVPAAHTISSIGTTTSVTAPTVTTIPVAKVPPQRQLPQSPQTSEFTRETTNQTQFSQASSMFTAQHRGSPSTNVLTATTSVPTTQADGRAQDRPGQIPIPYTPFPEYVYYSSAINPYHHQNLMLQQQVAAAAHAQAFTSLPSGAPIRPGIVPSQNPNLAATLQPNPSVTVSSTQPVRINPMMVTVDPNRHTSLAVHPSYPSTTEVSATGTTETTLPTATTAIHSTSTTQVTMTTQSQPPPSPMAQTVSNNPTASPRPSILRKRTNEGMIVAKKNLLSSLESGTPPLPAPSPQPPASPKPSSVPCDPSRENSQSSTDTATSAESTPQSSQTPELKVKQEPLDSLENGPLGGTGAASTPSLPNSVEASPRKKPRKQLLNANEELKDGTSSDDEEEVKFAAKLDLKSQLERVAALNPEDAEFVDDEGIRWVSEKKRPNISLLNHYQFSWKSRNNHFQRHSDVKPKEERRPTVNELSNVKGVMQKASGWKLYHLAAQLEEMMDLERDVFKKLGSVQESIAPKHIAKHTMEDDISKVHELTQGNIQRCQLVIDQLDEARSSMLKILEHKQRISEIVTKHRSKRPVKKKERS